MSVQMEDEHLSAKVFIFTSFHDGHARVNTLQQCVRVRVLVFAQAYALITHAYHAQTQARAHAHIHTCAHAHLKLRHTYSWQLPGSYVGVAISSNKDFGAPAGK
jgi:hypothetical protein